MNYVIKHTAILLCLLSLLLAGCKKDDLPNSTCYTVGYIPSQCGPNPFTLVLGVQDNEGKYYFIQKDETGVFKNFKEGDKVKMEFTRILGCIMAQSCTFPDPDFCITLNRVKPCGTRRVCKRATIDRNYLPTTQEYHMISDVKQEGNFIKLTISFSGCDSDINPELILKRKMVKPYPQAYSAYIKFNRVPQLCKPIFQKEI